MGTDYKRTAMALITHQHVTAVARLLAERDALAEQLAAVCRAAAVCKPWCHVRAGWVEVSEDRLRELMDALGEGEA